MLRKIIAGIYSSALALLTSIMLLGCVSTWAGGLVSSPLPPKPPIKPGWEAVSDAGYFWNFKYENTTVASCIYTGIKQNGLEIWIMKYYGMHPEFDFRDTPVIEQVETLAGCVCKAEQFIYGDWFI